MALNKDKELRMFYNIKQVAAMFGVTETTLRFWEKEFPNLHPAKGGRGIRQYSKDDIEQVRIVHHLVKERGLTLQGARDAIRSKKGVTNAKLDVVEKLKKLKLDLQRLSKELNGLV